MCGHEPCVAEPLKNHAHNCISLLEIARKVKQKRKNENIAAKWLLRWHRGKTEMVAGCWARAVQEITIPTAGFEYPLGKVLWWSVCPSLVCAVQAGIHSTSQALWQRHPESLYWVVASAREGRSDARYIFIAWDKRGQVINQCFSFEVNSVLICLVYNLWCRYVCVTPYDHQRRLQAMLPDTAL